MAIIWCLRYNRQFLIGSSIDLMTDHKPLLFLLKQSTPNGRIARWQTILGEFDIKQVGHISGESNITSDYLSRYGYAEDPIYECPTICTLKSSLLHWVVPTTFKSKVIKSYDDINNSAMVVLTSDARGLKPNGSVEKVIQKYPYVK